MAFLSCKEEERLQLPFSTVETLEISDITRNGAVFNAKIVSDDLNEIIEYGFIWSEEKNQTFDNCERIIIFSSPSENTYKIPVSSALTIGKPYFVRAFIKTSKNTVIGEDREFISQGGQAPSIYGFSSNSVAWLDTLDIIGKGFSYLPSNNALYFDSIRGQVIKASDTLIRVITPVIQANKAFIRVRSPQLWTISEKYVEIGYPKIVSIHPKEVTFEDTVVLKTQNMSHFGINDKVRIDGIETQIISFNQDSIVIKVPNEIKKQENEISLLYKLINIVTDQKITYKSPVIDSAYYEILNKDLVKVTVIGKHFNPILENNTLDGFAAIEGNSNRLSFEMYFDRLISNYYESQSIQRSYSLYTSTPSQLRTSFSFQVSWKSLWTKKGNFPGNVSDNQFSFSIDGKIYYASGDEKMNLWEYNPITDNWSMIGEFPGGPRYGAVTFVINNEAYIGLGALGYWNKVFYTDFYKYKPSNNSWIKLNDFPYEGRVYSVSTADATKGLITLGGTQSGDYYLEDTNESFEYNPINDSWSQQADSPIFSNYSCMFSDGVNIYLSVNGDFYKYNNQNWELILSTSYNVNQAFYIQEKLYIVAQTYDGGRIFELNLETSYQRLIANYGIYGNLIAPSSNKAYFIQNYNSINETWEYDPELPVY
ncbi:hypothetical protein QWY31_10200 [Cytophagales bacterium LB-30]|uniref:Uncharacterized protein n=1 Tax=Shiella aurantiaca TaxID=3058365 RepID=A0ABT8F5Y4_9BACT|nr:hypothetical protein [Shiella aurantiaca]MDN4165877.1 hypothetical protein [Shiella aurantiaca]